MTELQTVAQEKVARALCVASGWSPDRLIVTGPLEGKPKWFQYKPDADAAIAATLHALMEMDLPEDALRAADEALVWYENGLAGIYGPEFRAVIASLQDLFSKEAT